MAKIVQNIRKNIKQKFMSGRVLKSEICLAVFIAALGFITYCYIDLKSLTSWSVNLLDVIYEGRPLDFYEYSAQNIYGAPHEYTGADIFPFIPWAIWNIPVWIMQRFFGKAILESAFMLAWSKLFLVAVLFLCLYLTYKICMLLFLDKAKSLWAVFLSAASVYVFAGVFYAGQNDIVMIAFSLLAVYMLFKDKRNWFYFFTACSVAVKPYFLFAYIAIILLTEKKIRKIILQILASFSILFLCKLLYWNAPMYRQSMEQGPISAELIKLFGPVLGIGAGEVSLFLISLIIVYFICYVRKEEKEGQRIFIIYIITALYSLNLLFSWQNFYRGILLVPFVFIALIFHEKNFRLNIILQTVAGLACICRNFIVADTFINVGYMEDASLIYRIFGHPINRMYLSKQPMIEGFTSTTLYALSSVFAACVVIFLIINHPSFRWKKNTPVLEIKCERWLIWLYILSPVPFLAVSWILDFAVK